MTAPASSQARVGRRPLVELSAPPTCNRRGNPVNPVARLFEEWLTVRQATNHIASPRTLAGYRDDMARWATLLAAPGDGTAWDRLALDDLTEPRIHQALAAMNAAGLSVAARQRALAPLRGFCRWLTRHHHLTVDPTSDDELTIRTTRTRLPASFSTEELARIDTVVGTDFEDQRHALRWPARDQATLALLAGCGLRISEACELTWQRIAELDTDQPRLRVRGKSNRERAIPLPPRATAMMRIYRDERTQQGTKALAVRPRSPVLLQTDGRPVSPTVVNTWIERWLRHAGVARRPGALAHAFRHTAADGWLDNGATLAEVQALLGHASIATTGIYTTARPDTLAAVTSNGRYESLPGRRRSRDIAADGGIT